MQKGTSRRPAKDSQSRVSTASKPHRRSSEHGSSVAGHRHEDPAVSKKSKSQKSARKDGSSDHRGSHHAPSLLGRSQDVGAGHHHDEPTAGGYSDSSNPFTPMSQVSYVSEEDESATSYAPTRRTESPSAISSASTQRPSKSHHNQQASSVEYESESERNQLGRQVQPFESLTKESTRGPNSYYYASYETDTGTEYQHSEAPSPRGVDMHEYGDSRSSASSAWGEVAPYQRGQVGPTRPGIRGTPAGRAMTFPANIDSVIVPGYVADRFVGHATQLISQTIDAEKQNAASKTGLKYEQRINARMAEELQTEKAKVADLERHQREQQTIIANQAGWLEDARHQTNDARSRLESTQASLSRLQAQLRSAETELRESTALAEELQAQHAHEQGEAESILHELSRAQEDRDSLQLQLDSMALDNASLDRQVEEKRKERDRLRSGRESLQAQVKSLEWDKWDLTKKLGDKRKEVDRLTKDLKRANAETQKAQGGEAEAIERASTMGDDLASCQKDRDEYQQKVLHLEFQLAEQQHYIESMLLSEEQQSADDLYALSWLSYSLKQNETS